MSERSFRRDQQRRIAAAKRRDSLRARKAAAAAVAAGAFALAAPAASSAANFVVNDAGTNSGVCAPNATPAGCTLPDAIDQANANTEDDTITFDSALTGSTIDLTSGTNTGPLVVDSNYNLTITGLGAGNLTVSAGGASRVFDVQNTGYSPGLSISGLTIADGSSNVGGGIYTDFNTYLTLSNSVVTGNSATGVFYNNGPVIYFAASGGGLANAGQADISNSVFTGNHSTGTNGPFGGGGIDNAGKMTLSDSLVTGNDAAEYGGGIFNGGTKYPVKLAVNNTTVSGNYANRGGGGVGSFDSFGSKYGGSQNTINNSTITGNYADDPGAGIALKYTRGNDRWTVSHSTISNNSQAPVGGGVSLGAGAGQFTLIDSTISGNHATYAGGGLYASGYAQKYQNGINLQNSTIASNDSNYAGGIAFASTNGGPNDKYPVHQPIGSTIVADNTPNDLDQESGGLPGTGFDLSFDLIENVGNADITELPPGSNIFGTDPQLGPLANNGGPTQTQLPSINSPVVDKGNAPSGLTTDQRGEPRTVDTSPANANDGTDIGAVELPTGPPVPAGGNLGTKVHNVKKKHKKRRRIIRTFHNSVKIHLTFSSPIAGAVFTCSVDGGAFEPCTSPFSVRLKSAPGHGATHEITIVTRDQAGNQLGKPKTFKFRIIKKT